MLVAKRLDKELVYFPVMSWVDDAVGIRVSNSGDVLVVPASLLTQDKPVGFLVTPGPYKIVDYNEHLWAIMEDTGRVMYVLSTTTPDMLEEWPYSVILQNTDYLMWLYDDVCVVFITVYTDTLPLVYPSAHDLFQHVVIARSGIYLVSGAHKEAIQELMHLLKGGKK